MKAPWGNVDSRAEAGNVRVSLEHVEPKCKETPKLQGAVKRHRSKPEGNAR